MFKTGIESVSRMAAKRRLARIISYYRHTTLIESERQREQVLSGLLTVRKQWRRKSWSEIYPYEDDT